MRWRGVEDQASVFGGVNSGEKPLKGKRGGREGGREGTIPPPLTTTPPAEKSLTREE